MLTSFATDPDPLLQAAVAFHLASPPELLEIVATNYLKLDDGYHIDLGIGFGQHDKYSILELISKHGGTPVKVKRKITRIMAASHSR